MIGETTVVGVVTTLIAAVVIGFPNRSIRLPLIYGGDELAGLGHVTGVNETGWWFENPRLGAPFSLEHYDFPHGGDSLQILMVRIITLVSDSAALTLNLYFLLTFFLVAAAAHIVMRHLGFNASVSAVVSCLYALLPFHFWHGTPHIYRSGYFAVPLACLVLLWIAGFRGGLWHSTGPRWRDIAPKWPRIATAVVAMLIVGTTDTVAAAFAPTLAGTIGLTAIFLRKDPRPFVAGMLFGIGVVAVVVVANIGTLLYVQENGPNAETVNREISEQERFGLKLSRVVLPSESHRVDALAELGSIPLDSPIRSEGGQALGIIGVIGLLAGLISLSGISRRADRAETTSTQPSTGQPDDQSTAESLTLLQLTGSINLAAILIAVPGGLAFILSIIGFEEIRTWNRIIVYIGFFAFIAVAIGLSSIQQWCRGSGRGALGGTFLLGVLLLGVFDQTPETVGDPAAIEQAWAIDAEFFAAVESDLKSDTDPMLFVLPLVPYPEPARGTYLIDYQHMRPLIHTETVEFSYAAIRGRPESNWQQQLAQLPVPLALDALASIGFDGIYVDRWALKEGPERILFLLGEPELELGRNQLYTFGDRANQLRAFIGEQAMETLATETVNSANIDLALGFHTQGQLSGVGSFGQDGAVMKISPSFGEPISRTIMVDVLAAPGAGHTVQLAIGGTVIDTAVSAADRQIHLEATIDIPADGLEITLLTDGPPFQAVGDTRQIQFALIQVLALGEVSTELYRQLDPTEIADALAP